MLRRALTVHRFVSLPLWAAIWSLTFIAVDARAEPSQPESRSERSLQGWTIAIDDRLNETEHVGLRDRAMAFLEAKLFDITMVVSEPTLSNLRKVRIVLDLECGKLGSMQYHPSADWLTSNGYPADLEKCVHLPRAADVATRRNINEQPWVILHELAHAYHDQVLGFEEPKIMDAYKAYKASGHGDATLLFNGERVKHYALTDQKEFFAEMTESYFGCNDFYPFTRAELKTSEPALYELLHKIWQQPN